MQRIHSANIAVACGMLAAASLAKPLDLPLGARPFGMGGAFVAVADDATAAYWNAAGLGQITSLTLSETNWMLQEVSDVNTNYFTGAIPISNVGTVAGGWQMQYASLEQGEPGVLRVENAWYEHTFSLAAGRELWKKLWIFENTSVGFSLDRYVLNSGDQNGAGTGFDVGFLTRFPYGIRWGVVARSLGADMMGDKVSPEFRSGLGYVWERQDKHRAVVDLDIATKEDVEYENSVDGVDRNWKAAFGAEYTYHQDEWNVSARAGVNSGFINSRDMLAVSGGVGGGYRGFRLEYGYQFNTNENLSLGPSHQVTLEVRLGEFLKHGEKEQAAVGKVDGDLPMGSGASN